MCWLGDVNEWRNTWSGRSTQPADWLSSVQAAKQAGVAVPEPIAKGTGLAHGQGVDVATKAQQAERVAHAAATEAPEGTFQV